MIYKKYKKIVFLKSVYFFFHFLERFKMAWTLINRFQCLKVKKNSSKLAESKDWASLHLSKTAFKRNKKKSAGIYCKNWLHYLCYCKRITDFMYWDVFIMYYYNISVN
jgi:hypothetical protein